jgi:3-oxoacyl-[acyl-carrier protein] reductase
MDVRGKRAIVTGGVKGLGFAIVEALLSKEAFVTVFDVDSAGLSDLRSKHPAVNCIECDVSDYEQVQRASARYHEENKSAEILVNNAGILYSAPLVKFSMSGIEKHDVGMWHKTLAVNLNSVFYMTACIVEKMMTTRTRGVIVNISSISASGNAGQSAYSASKAAVNALTATWSKELGAMGIRVAAVAPGFTDTDSTHTALSDAVLQETIKRVPLRRLGKPQEIAQGVLSIIENDFFNGKVYELDGGLVI